ncbi:zinc finger, CCHC-type containing protein [Tanacetum coccineum]|uniref:Zinc finger, CCHC-type containing protein n=1 Tax=Tanacetum coccineum TaxID=301880 RepID=A0ABQ4ZX27_9ASTR
MLTIITKGNHSTEKRETDSFWRCPTGDLCDLHATPSLGNKKYFVTFIDDASRFCYVYLLHTKDEALDKFKVFKTEVELQGSLIKRFKTDRRGLSQGFWGEALLTACYLLNSVPNKRNMITPYELLTKEKQNLNYLRIWGCRAVVRLPDPKLKLWVKEALNASLLNMLSIPRILDTGGSVVPEEVVTQQPGPELRKGKKNRTPKNFGPKFQLYLIEGTRDEVSDQHSYCFNVEDDPKRFDEAMKS